MRSKGTGLAPTELIAPERQNGNKYGDVPFRDDQGAEEGDRACREDVVELL